MSDQKFYNALGEPVSVEGEIVAHVDAPNGYVRCIVRHSSGRETEVYLKGDEPPKDKPAP